MIYKNALFKLWPYLTAYKVKLFIILLSLFLSTVTKVLGPYLMGISVDKYIATYDIKGLLGIIAFLIFIYLATSFFTWLQSYLMIGVAGATINVLRKNLFTKIQSLSLKYFDSTPHGEIMSRFTNDVDNINTTLNESLIELLANTLTLIGVIIFMLILNVKLALITLISTPLIFILTTKIAKKTKESFTSQQQRLGVLNGFIEENIAGFKSIKANGIGDEIATDFNTLNNSLKEASVQAQIYSGTFIPLIGTFNNINLAIIVSFGAWLTIIDEASVGVIVAFINFARQFFQPLNQIASLYNQIQLAITGAERVFEVMDKEADIKDTSKSMTIKNLSGNVQLKHVSFGYNENKLVLKDINIHAYKGQMIALIGPTGCGKSTIINLLTRFYDLKKGQILFDNHAIKMLKIKDLRKRIGVVLQDTIIFTGTVNDNIKFGNLEATDEEVINAAKLANIHDFIETLPDKYNTLLDGNGSLLSVGQKQLISIARTIISNPDIIILDEATSNIDTRTEVKIQNAMQKVMENRTSFVIAHRLKTILHADEIIVLKEGHIIERGTHQQLLKANGFYTSLYNTQFNVNKKSL